MPHKECNRRRVEIEVTPEMMKAGVDAICELSLTEDPFEEMSAAIYMAVQRVADQVKD